MLLSCLGFAVAASMLAYSLLPAVGGPTRNRGPRPIVVETPWSELRRASAPGTGAATAVPALVDFDRPSVGVLSDGTAPPLAHLVLDEHLRPEGAERRDGLVERRDVKPDERAAVGPPTGCRRPSPGGPRTREDGDVHAADVSRRVEAAVAVVLVLEAHAERAVEDVRAGSSAKSTIDATVSTGPTLRHRSSLAHEARRVRLSGSRN